MGMMTRAEIESLFERRRRAWDAHDAAAMAATHSIDGVVKSPMFGDLYGREEIEASYARAFHMFPDWAMVDEPLLVDGNTVVEVFSSTATHSADFMGLPATGRHFRIEGVRIHVVKDGLVHEERRLYDFTSLLIQVGVLKGKPAV